MLILQKILLCAEIVVFVIFTFAIHSAHFRRAHRVIVSVKVNHFVRRASIAHHSSFCERRCFTLLVFLSSRKYDSLSPCRGLSI